MRDKGIKIRDTLKQHILNNKKETVFVRYKSSEAENQYLKVVEDKLLQDKKNFKIKRKYL